jgi:hypothetical protein
MLVRFGTRVALVRADGRCIGRLQSVRFEAAEKLRRSIFSIGLEVSSRLTLLINRVAAFVGSPFEFGLSWPEPSRQ